MENAPQVQHAAALIAQFLRNILTLFNRNITVEEEFSIVDIFVEIQNLRFGSRIKVESSLDVGAEWFVIPSMTMQPLVENAYRHGLADRKGMEQTPSFQWYRYCRTQCGKKHTGTIL